MVIIFTSPHPPPSPHRPNIAIIIVFTMPNPYGLCGRKAALYLNKSSELRSCTCESRGGRPGFPVPNCPYGLCGRDATLNTETIVSRAVVDLCAVWGLRSEPHLGNRYTGWTDRDSMSAESGTYNTIPDPSHQTVTGNL